MGGDEIVVTVDTHVIIWNDIKPELLTSTAKESLDEANQTDGLIFCDISVWEIAMLMQKNRIEVDVGYLEFINLLKAANNYVFKNITPEIAELATTLPSEINQDPADRIICATSILMNSPLITSDQNLRKSELVNTIW